MSNNHAFRCPVCRASQRPQATCRRCDADLRLVAGALRRVEYLLSEIEKAQASGDHQRKEGLILELRWLAPHRR